MSCALCLKTPFILRVDTRQAGEPVSTELKNNEIDMSAILCSIFMRAAKIVLPIVNVCLLTNTLRLTPSLSLEVT